IRKVEHIVREEMNKTGALEVLLPAIHPSELWIESGRWESAGPELLRIKDRHDRSYCFGPTHEEVITDLVRREIRSYRDLPRTFYQIQTKFRDEVRPRFGLLRGREFIMKDAYSFDVSDEQADTSYQAMYNAYFNIFKRCGLKFRVVDADTGNIGGKTSQEFMVLAKSGEDKLIVCSECHYAANIEKAYARIQGDSAKVSSVEEMFEVHTPGVESIDEVSKFLKKVPEHLLKVLFYECDDKYICAVVLTGDREVNEVKLKRHLQVNDLKLASHEDLEKISGSFRGYCGPFGLVLGKDRLQKIVVDIRVQEGQVYVSGANKKDFHMDNVVPGRDFEIVDHVDIHDVRAGDLCRQCGKTLVEERGIEVGHIFKLGTKYSESMGAFYTDVNGKQYPVVMGCYGIGITRVAAAAIEQNHDDSGIVFPPPLAPFDVSLILVDLKNSDLKGKADEIYAMLLSNGIDVLYDDREVSPGGKFKDSDLLGIPLRVTVGKKSMLEGKVEVKVRSNKGSTLVDPSALLKWVNDNLTLKP
ncbi:MAG: proline--tRNA ligase, partial [Bdellovibrionales bacterium]|nr:proline--tRNA ligase [Bdellovibrionales bacterium]